MLYVLLKLSDIWLCVNLFSNCILLLSCFFWWTPVVRCINKLLCPCVILLCINIICHFTCAHNLILIKIIFVSISIELIYILIINFTNLFLRFAAVGWTIVEIHLTITLGNLLSFFVTFVAFLTTWRLTLNKVICLGLRIAWWHLGTRNQYLLLLRINH